MSNNIKSFLNKTRVETILLVFFILQPAIEIYRAFLEDTISIGPIALEQIINILFVAFFFILAVYKLITEKQKKENNTIWCISCHSFSLYNTTLLELQSI